jgi:hypothetical protein
MFFRRPTGLPIILDILDVCPTKEEIAEKVSELSAGKFRRPVMMLAIDGAHAPTRPEPSPREGKRGKANTKKPKVSEYILLIKIGLFI